MVSPPLLCSLTAELGGAERLVVDAALGLQKMGHHVEIYTSHHDPNHCFDETQDGMAKLGPSRDISDQGC